MEAARAEHLNPEPRNESDYSKRQTIAARRVLVDVGQVLASDKPKDTYDFCYCLEHFPAGMNRLAEGWKHRTGEKNIAKAIEVLREKFASVEAFGPLQLVEFHSVPDTETQAMQARRAYELVQKFLKYCDPRINVQAAAKTSMPHKPALKNLK
jgi:hypothetical protein